MYEKRSIASEIPIWDPELCIDCGLCALSCPHAAIRMKVFDPMRAVNGSGNDASPASRGRARSIPGCSSRSRSRPTTAPDAGSASTSAPPAASHRRSTRPSTWSRRVSTSRRSVATSSYFLALPEADRRDIRAGDAQGVAAAAAALRVLGGLRRLRRDALPQAPDAALRRPHSSSRTPPAARRSTAATCRRRRGPWTPNGRGPAWANSLFEDNAEFGLGMAPGSSTITRRLTPAMLVKRARPDRSARISLGTDPG